MVHKINVCILTLQREELLSKCLASFESLEFPPGTSVSITVVDNDEMRASEGLVETFSNKLAMPVFYVCEPIRGIPVARNTAIEFSHKEDFDYMAFIDDDEWVASDWLMRAYSYCQSKGGAVVVSGNVVSEFPSDTPEHIKAVMQRKQRKTGVELSSCATNNVLFPIALTKDLGLRFDVTNPLAGGTDTIFFAEAKLKGVGIYKCAEALVYEKVPRSRATLAWMSRRKFRVGVTESRRRLSRGQGWAKIFVSSFFHIFVKLLAALLAVCTLNQQKRNRAWLKCCKAAGVLGGLVGVEVDSYKTIDS